MVDYLEEGRTINGACYAENTKSAVSGHCEDKKRKVDWRCSALAPASTSQVAMAAATKCSFEILPLSTYSADLAPSDFYLFPNLKTDLPGRNFGSNEGVIDPVGE